MRDFHEPRDPDDDDDGDGTMRPGRREFLRVGELLGVSIEQARKDSRRNSIAAEAARNAETNAVERGLRLDRAHAPRSFRAQLTSQRDLRATPAIEAARDALAGGLWLLFLLGGLGRGKSFAAAWLLSARPGRFVDVGELVQPSREFYDDMRYLPVLVVDDLGIEPRGAADGARGTFERLIAGRFNDGLLTAVTSNLPPSELFGADGYGDRLEARLRPPRGHVVVCGGPDLRAVCLTGGR